MSSFASRLEQCLRLMVLSIVLTLTACSGGGGDGVPPVTGGDRIVSIDSGGYISIPENALPDSAQVSVAPTRTPILPDDVMPVGEALAISATEDLLEPATLHLPIPAGVVDPANLVIVRVEPNGRTTFFDDVGGGERARRSYTGIFHVFRRQRIGQHEVVRFWEETPNCR